MGGGQMTEKRRIGLAPMPEHPKADKGSNTTDSCSSMAFWVPEVEQRNGYLTDT
jgi:hypothetical protein